MRTIMNKRIKQRVTDLLELASNMNNDKRRDYNSRLKSFIDKAEKLDKMNKALFSKGEKQQAMDELWTMYQDTLKHLSMFYTASKFIDTVEQRAERADIALHTISEGIENGDILDALHTNMALEHMSNDGFYKIHTPKKVKSDSNWLDESWNRNTDNSGSPEYVYLDDMSDSSLEAMLTSYAVTFDNTENEYDRELSQVAYLDKMDSFTFS